jgi:hypothetical protein
MTVKGNLNTVGSSGATTGTNAKVTFDNNTNFEARGTAAGSSTQLTYVNGAGDADIAGNNKILRKSKPTVALVALPNTVLAPGTLVATRVSITADAAGDVALRGLVSSIVNGTAAGTVTADNIATSSIRVVGDSSNIAGTSAFVAACTAGVSCVLVSEFTSEYVIPAGTTKTFDVRVSLSAAATGDSLRSGLLGDTTLATGVLTGGTPATKISVAGTASNFVWSDISLVSHSATISGPSSADWMNGTYVKVLPPDLQTMSK